MAIDRYRPIIPDWDLFLATVERPEPVAFRVARRGKSAERIVAELRAEGFEVDAVADVPDFLQVKHGPRSVAQTLSHWRGFFHIQQAVMGLPSLALEPRPGDRVLDLCAAPGGKTAHLADLMDRRGPLVAVDPKEKRLRGLLGNLYRLGVANVLVVAADGRRLPAEARFDRVLVDAPCSGEGNIRRHSAGAPGRTSRFSDYVTGVQEALLRRAIDLTEPGGSIVYSTCTFAPEENEGVVDRVVRDTPVALEEIPLGAPHEPGLEEWNGHGFVPEMSRAWRVYPHHLDSGGLFMARLRKLGPATRSDGWASIPPAFPGESAEASVSRVDTVLSELESRFGIGRHALESVQWMVRGDHVWIHTAGLWPEAMCVGPGRSRLVSAGLRATRSGPGGRETPSNQAVVRWGDGFAPERRLAVARGDLLELLEGGHLAAGNLPTGPLALTYRDVVLGRGVVGRLGLAQEFGRARAARLAAMIAEEA